MIRRPLGGAPMPNNGPRFNEFIVSPKVRVIDENGENLGVMLTREAMEQARQLGMVLLQRVQADTVETAKVEAYPRMEGRQMLMVLSPK